jgi:DEAD/DEAH box helicase domain-containing protein
MIPAIVADELRATMLDYLDTTFSFQSVEVAQALQRFLTDLQHGIFKGHSCNCVCHSAAVSTRLPRRL